MAKRQAVKSKGGVAPKSRKRVAALKASKKQHASAVHRVAGPKTHSIKVSKGRTVAAHTVRDEFSHTVNRVMNKGERIFVSRHGRHVVAMVPMDAGRVR